jgi:hypothetical protein
MTSVLSDSLKPGAKVADWIVPYRAGFVSISAVHAISLYTGTASFFGNVDLHGSVATGSVLPVAPNDIISKDYYDAIKTHLLTNRGDLITSDGVNDVILPAGSAGQLLTVHLATPTGLAWDTLPDNHVSSDVTFAGPWALGITASCFWESIDGVCAMRIATFQNPGVNPAPATAAAGTIPAAYRPAITQRLALTVLDNSHYTPGYIILNPDGSMVASPLSGAFGIVGNVGLCSCMVVYYML